MGEGDEWCHINSIAAIAAQVYSSVLLEIVQLCFCYRRQDLSGVFQSDPFGSLPTEAPPHTIDIFVVRL